MAKPQGRAKLFQDPDRAVKDNDPESIGAASDHEEGSDASVDENAGTEHYEAVGKSKLRKSGGVSLGSDYRGARVTRNALEQDSEDDGEDDDDDDDSGSEEYDDPDMIDLEADEAEASDSEIDSDNALAQSDEERFRDFAFRGSSKPAKGKGKAKASRAIAADFMSSDEEPAEANEMSDLEENEDDNSSEDEDMDDGLDALANGADDSEEESSSADDEDEDSEAESEENSPPSAKQPQASTEVAKGLAIQKQRKMYDGLLNLRIRLQKALVASNTIPALDETAASDSEPYLAAEEAAVKLLNTISNLKEDFGSKGAHTGEKRKRDITAGMTSGEIWEQLQADEMALAKFRHDRLNKWSRKVQTVNVRQPSGLSSRNGNGTSKSLTDALEEQLLDPEGRLLKRTRVPRSCAPAQAAKRLAEDAAVYDDADFYQQLLKELVDQRTLDVGDASGAAAALPSVVLTAAGKDVKMRKNVDRKASKGRKMRFTVHEKIQNFMAPEDRRTWEQAAIDRFFSTMFGQRMELDEDESADDDDDVDDLRADAEGLRLFQ